MQEFLCIERREPLKVGYSKYPTRSENRTADVSLNDDRSCDPKRGSLFPIPAGTTLTAIKGHLRGRFLMRDIDAADSILFCFR